MATLTLAGDTPLAGDRTGFYLGASITSAQIEVKHVYPDFGDMDFDEKDTGYKLFAGYRFLDFLAVEGGYVDFGHPTYSTVMGDMVLNTRFALDGWDACLIGILPIGPVDLFAKAGFFWWDSEFEAAIDNSSWRGLDSGADPVYGVGVALWLGQFSIRAEYEVFDISEADNVNQISLGVAYTF
jgi:hypothetical protein